MNIFNISHKHKSTSMQWCLNLDLETRINVQDLMLATDDTQDPTFSLMRFKSSPLAKSYAPLMHSR